MSGREVFAIGLEHDDAHGAIGGCAHQHLVELVEHRGRLGVGLVGAVQRDDDPIRSSTTSYSTDDSSLIGSSLHIRSMMIAGAMPPAAHIVISAVAAVGALELVEGGADQDRAGGADGMTEGDRTAVDVDLVAVDVEVADELLDDDGERLVDLEDVDVVDRQSRLGEHLAGGGNRGIEHQGR